MKIRRRNISVQATVFSVLLVILTVLGISTTVFAASGGRQGAAELAASQIGLTNGTKYGAGNGEAWCAYFAGWCARNGGGIGTSEWPNSGSTTVLVDKFQRMGRWHDKSNTSWSYNKTGYGTISGGGKYDGYKPQPGDFVAIDNNGKVGDGPEHTGIVYSVVGNTLTTIEGNISKKVVRVTYNLSTLRPTSNNVGSSTIIIGFGEPAYKDVKLSPRVMVDSLQANDDGTIRLRGWAFDQDNTSATVTIHTYIGGKAGEAGAEGWAFPAELDSPDVNQAYGISGKHRFDVIIKTGKRGNQTVVVYALDTNQGENTCYGVMNVNITNSNAIAIQDTVTVDEGSSINLDFTFHGDGIIQLAGENRDGSIISFSWGNVDWNNTQASINIKGLKKGETFLDLYFLDGNKNKFYKKSIGVTVKHVHKYTIEKITKQPTCSGTGLKKYYCSCGAVSSQTTTIGKKTHVYVTDKAIEATCTQPGKTEGKHCSLCGYVYKKQDVIPAKGHSYVVNKEIPATCTNSGWTEEKYCSVCWTVFSEQEKIPAKGHNYVVDKAVAATCTTSGKTEGKHCLSCGYIAVAQKEIPIKEHTYKNGVCIWCGKKTDSTSSSEDQNNQDNSSSSSDDNKQDGVSSNNQDKNTNSTNSSANDQSGKEQGDTSYETSDDYNDTDYEDSDYDDLDNEDDGIKISKKNSFKSKNLYYGIISHKKKQVTVLRCLNKNIKSINIPSTVKYKGRTYTVVSIHAKAFANLKKLKKVTIGSNIKTIEKNAFYNCKRLKTIQINTTKLKKIGKRAFGKLNEKCIIYVKNRSLNRYRKLLLKTDLNRTVKIKAY